MSILRRICVVTFLSILSMTQAIDTVAASEPNSAQTLFLEAIVLLEDKRFDEACSKFERSLALERNPSALFALGECNEQRGHFVTAIKTYTDYIDAYGELPDAKKPQHETRMTRAQERLEALRSQVSALTVIVASAYATGFEVSLDGQKTRTTHSEITLYPLEPGEHRVIVQVPAAKPKAVPVTLEKGKDRRLEIQVEFPPKPVPTPSEPHGEIPVVAPNPPPSTTTMKLGGIVALGVGGAGLVMGIVGAAYSISNRDVVAQNCTLIVGNRRSFCKNQAGVDAGNIVKNSANLATAGISIAAAGAITGTILLWVDRRTAKASKEAERRLVIPRFGADKSGVRVFLEGVW